MKTNLQRKPLLLTLLIISCAIIYLVINYFSLQILDMGKYLYSRKEIAYVSFKEIFQYVTCFYLGISIFLIMIGRNMHTWNYDSHAKTLID
jgi:hypothetical protein